MEGCCFKKRSLFNKVREKCCSNLKLRCEFGKNCLNQVDLICKIGRKKKKRPTSPGVWSVIDLKILGMNLVCLYLW